VHEAPAIIGTCINCIAPGSLSATLALIGIGAGIVLKADGVAPAGFLFGDFPFQPDAKVVASVKSPGLGWNVRGRIT
jgi:hypothetical protein